MSGCTSCGGFGDRHDPIAHGAEPEWITCHACRGRRTIRLDLSGLDVDCSTCDGDGGWEP